MLKQENLKILPFKLAYSSFLGSWNMFYMLPQDFYMFIFSEAFKDVSNSFKEIKQVKAIEARQSILGSADN